MNARLSMFAGAWGGTFGGLAATVSWWFLLGDVAAALVLALLAVRPARVRPVAGERVREEERY